ncbi:uncharacterized protein [Diadema setosum]|uniref:uncharacterized protein n=1 Tax=Diadema setosum TaxID=31175 RepID=UPI003B3B6161
MDFLNKPMLEAWKATKRTLAEIMDSNDGGRSPGPSSQRSSFDQAFSGEPGPSGLSHASGTGRKSRSSIGYSKGHHKSLESNLNVVSPDVERENRPVDYNNIGGSRVGGSGLPHSTSTDSLDFAEVQKSPNPDQTSPQSVPRIRSKDKQGSDKERTKNAWTKFRLGYLSKGTTSMNVNDTDVGSAEKSPILPTRMDKTSPTHTISSSVGSPGKSKMGSRTSRRSRGDITQKGFDFRSRFRSNSSDRATMRRREREEKERTRRLSYTRSTSFDANEAQVEDVTTSEDAGEDQAEKVKNKLMSMWNNVKYGWTVKTKTTFSAQKPIWFLGKCYHQRPEDPDPERPIGMDTVRSMVVEEFKQDFSSRLWMTYRREFPTLAGSNFTSDCGWGCMLRSGQMLLAHSLILHFLGREWNIYKQQTPETQAYHRQIIRWFGDQPLDMSPFSVHRLVSIGQLNGKKVGDWYGPASVAHILKEAMDDAHELNPLLGQVCIYVAQDCTVYKQDVIDLCRSKSQKLLQPVYKDVCTERSQPIRCVANSKDQARTSGLHHQQLQRSSPASKDHPQSTTSSLESSRRVGSRLAHGSPQGPGLYGMSAMAGRLEPPAGSGKDSSCELTSTSTNHSDRDSPSNFDTGAGTPGIEPGLSKGEDNTLLPSRTSPDIHSGSPTGEQGESETSSCSRTQPETGTSQDILLDPGDAVHSTVDDERHRNVEMEDMSNFSSPVDEDNEVFELDDGLQGKSALSQQEEAKELKAVLEKPPMAPSENTSRHLPLHSDDPRSSQGSSSSDAFTRGESVAHDQRTRSRTGSSAEGEKPWCAVVILVPVRLGGDEVNPVYVRAIQSLFTLESCLGIIGGKPKHSLFFVGFQEEKLIHLDPHYCQQVVDMRSRDFPLWSFHCMSPRKMSISKMDPSCTVGFYIRTEKEFESFCDVISSVVTPLGSQSSDYPMFIIRNGRCGDWQNKNMNTNRPERYLRVRHVDENGRLIAPVRESEDFVLLDN